jgi:hypothetical protein
MNAQHVPSWGDPDYRLSVWQVLVGIFGSAAMSGVAVWSNWHLDEGVWWQAWVGLLVVAVFSLFALAAALGAALHLVCWAVFALSLMYVRLTRSDLIRTCSEVFSLRRFFEFLIFCISVWIFSWPLLAYVFW